MVFLHLEGKSTEGSGPEPQAPWGSSRLAGDARHPNESTFQWQLYRLAPVLSSPGRNCTGQGLSPLPRGAVFGQSVGDADLRRPHYTFSRARVKAFLLG